MTRNNADFHFGRLFHGSNQVFTPGDLILSTNATGASSRTLAEAPGDADDPNRRGNAFASEIPSISAGYAQSAAKTLGGDPHLYEVEPVNKEDVVHDFEDEHYSPSGFRVIAHHPLKGYDYSKQNINEKIMGEDYKKAWFAE